MDPKFLIVANWKADEPPVYNFTLPDSIEVAIAAPFPLIAGLPNQFTKAAQDVSVFASGAETGEVTAKILAQIGVKYCLVGHSERRRYFGETNEQVQQKLSNILQNDIMPIVCARSIEDIVPADLIMYEPSEAISSNGEYHPAKDINETLTDWQQKFPKSRFLYGGSVNPQNCKLLIENCKLLSGFVVGHASLDSTSFSAIINACAA